jgi:hypothetical protein
MEARKVPFLSTPPHFLPPLIYSSSTDHISPSWSTKREYYRLEFLCSFLGSDFSFFLYAPILVRSSLGLSEYSVCSQCLILRYEK